MNRDIAEKKLYEIHSKLTFNGGRLIDEFPEQIMSMTHIKEDDCVLELGGSCGRNSCVINYILANKENHVVIEPAKDEIEYLTANRDNNNLKYQIENSAISKEPLYACGWQTYTTQIPGSVPVSVLTYDELKLKYKLNFNVLVIDNEGNFVGMMKAFPNILDGIRLLIIEHDFNNVEDLDYFYKGMMSKGFKITDKFLKDDRYCPGIGWPDGVACDLIFISVWTK